MEISRSVLFGKLNRTAYKAIEGATVFCKMRGNPYVELVHWIQQIFMCYRRQDSNHFTGRIFDRLVARFGPACVFLDINSIDAGAKDFTKEIRQRLESAKVMLVMVGRRWLADDEGQRRLDDKTDHVRRELRWGLKHDMRVVPVLLDGARMPDAASLPAPLRAFSKIQAITIRSDAEFNRDVQFLVDELAGRLAKPPSSRTRH